MDDSTQSIAFGRNILSTDKDFLVTESSLGVTPFISLAPPLEFTPSGITAHFKSSFAHTDVISNLSDTQCPWAKTGKQCEFPSDAELQLFTRDPNELHDTLLTDDGWNYDFLFDSSTQRSYPTGEAVGFLNPTPYAVPAAIVMDVSGPPKDVFVKCPPFAKTCPVGHENQPVLNPVFSTDAWERSTNTGTFVANMNLWGSPASQPSGFGSIKAVRLAQHGPCEIEFPLQAPLNTLKEQVVQGLEQCYQDFGGNAAGGQILDLDILSFDAIPYVANQPSPRVSTCPRARSGSSSTGTSS